MTQSFPALVNRPSLIEYKQYRFLVMDAPTDSNLPAYIDILKKKHAIALVRACEPTYKTSPLLAAGIRVMDLPFDDGDPPPEHMLAQWLQLVHDSFGGFDAAAKVPPAPQPQQPSSSPPPPPLAPVTKTSSGSISGSSSLTSSASKNDLSAAANGHGSADATAAANKKCIGVHCVAGLGRAPVLVAIALIEAGMAPFEAIEFIRKKRRGAINARQLKYLENYKPRRRKVKGESGCCIQ